MRQIKRLFLLLAATLLFGIQVNAQTSIACDDCSKIEYAVVFDNYLYYAVVSEGIVRVSLSGKGNIEILDSFLMNNAGDPARCRIQGKYIYGISIIGASRSQMSYVLNRVQLDHFQLNNFNELKLTKPKSANDLPEHLQYGNEIDLRPLTVATTDSEVLQAPLFYDLTIGANYQITLYISLGRNIQVWRLADTGSAKWEKGEIVDIEINEPFTVIDKGGIESILLTESGEIYALNGKVYSRLTNGMDKIRVKENKENEIPIFIENKDSNEHWIISKIKGKDNKSYVAKSRSLKSTTVTDASLPVPINLALEKIQMFKDKNSSAK